MPWLRPSAVITPACRTLPSVFALVFAVTDLLAAEPVQYGRDVLPLLSNACFKCHGPDPETREADLRLDTRIGATEDRGGYQAIAPGDVDESELVRRLTSEDPDERMPPIDAVVQLNPKDIETLKAWVEQGAEYEQHWAFINPERPAIPQVARHHGVRNPIDAFVLARLEQEQLAPSPPASRATLIRRLSLDLTGLPPSPADVNAFLADDQPQAYERLVDQLLQTPHYGERMAWNWLDAARYADSNGYQGDRERTMWPWRDWVVAAFNDNMPYDQFTIWQLAGDLLPQATEQQRLATGFCRNHPINGEGGRIAEENRVDYVMDMAETTGTIWMALTLNCCRCHDHKFDPLKQRDYYSFTAFFNQTPVNGGGGDPQTPPVLAVPGVNDQEQVAKIRKALDDFDSQLRRRQEELKAEQDSWEKTQLAEAGAPVWHTLIPTSISAEHQVLTTLKDHSILASGVNPANDTYTIAAPVEVEQLTAIRIEALQHESMTKNGLARSDSGNFVLTELEVRLTTESSAEEKIPFSSAVATFEQGSLKANTAYDGNRNTGWAVYEGRFVDREHQAIFYVKDPRPVPVGSSLRITLRHDSQHVHHNLGRFRLSVSAAPAPKLESAQEDVRATLRTAGAARSQQQIEAITKLHRDSDPQFQQLEKKRQQTQAKLDALRKGFPKVMVMQDMAKPRKTYLLDRGLYNKPGDEVPMAVPASLPALPAEATANRLAMAQWLVSTEHPLTARVTVNRFWQQIFGIGLVKTSEDFGVQGERPVHQDLLDWLAVEFRESGWDTKSLLRLIVTSDTYRQSSRVDPQLLERDPSNRLLARGPRFRLPAWMLRDQALAVSGLLERRLAGPPVQPYQPPGVWEEASFGNKKYNQDHGESLYRRGLYTFWRRIAAPTMFFDNATRQVCTVNVLRTNTPLHSLLTLNDITFVEASRALAQLALQQADATDQERIDSLYLRVLARPAAQAEQTVLLAGLGRSRLEYAAAPDAAKSLLAIGESARDDSLDAVEHAAWTSLALAVLNLDETLTKE